jgi:hypothetical protein
MSYFPGITRRPGTSGGGVAAPSPPTTSTPIVQIAHGFSAGDLIYGTVGVGFAKALNNNIATLAYHVVASATADAFTIAKPGEIVNAYTGLIPYEWYHCSPTIAGGVAPVGSGQKPVGGFAANQVGQAVTSTSLIVYLDTPYEA